MSMVPLQVNVEVKLSSSYMTPTNVDSNGTNMVYNIIILNEGGVLVNVHSANEVKPPSIQNINLTEAG